jgi:hypothetical protein
MLNIFLFPSKMISADGLASTIMREALKDTSATRHWVVFDGPVDALWIENMNTVLDDNMMLCLSNGYVMITYAWFRIDSSHLVCCLLFRGCPLILSLSQ